MILCHVMFVLRRAKLSVVYLASRFHSVSLYNRILMSTYILLPACAWNFNIRYAQWKLFPLKHLKEIKMQFKMLSQFFVILLCSIFRDISSLSATFLRNGVASLHIEMTRKIIKRKTMGMEESGNSAKKCRKK